MRAAKVIKMRTAILNAVLLTLVVNVLLLRVHAPIGWLIFATLWALVFTVLEITWPFLFVAWGIWRVPGARQAIFRIIFCKESRRHFQGKFDDSR